LWVKFDFAFEKKVKKDSNCVVVAIDFETIAGEIDFRTGVPG
jgi:hypothetical protein